MALEFLAFFAIFSTGVFSLLSFLFSVFLNFLCFFFFGKSKYGMHILAGKHEKFIFDVSFSFSLHGNLALFGFVVSAGLIQFMSSFRNSVCL